jgi:putative DNA primase/helicase
MTEIDFDRVNREALSGGHRFLAELCPGGKLRGSEYTVLNPRRPDKKLGSFCINFKTGAWADFATNDRGGDVVSRVAYLRGSSQSDAAREISNRLRIELYKANGYSEVDAEVRSGRPVEAPIHTLAASPAGPSSPLGTLPARTPPNDRGRPTFFVGGDTGPRHSSDEIRRHVYRRDDVPIRVKVKRQDGSFVNWYRVADVDTQGWQSAKPDGYVDVPYQGAVDPFDTELLNDLIYWPEGERDVDALGSAHIPAFSFGGTGDGLPDAARGCIVGRHVVVLADNDTPGRRHAEQKAGLAFGISASVRVVHFPALEEKHDVSDWMALGHSADELERLAQQTPLWRPPVASGEQQPKPRRELIIQRASEITPEPIEWVWPGRLAIGKMTLVAGDPGLGKSQVAVGIAATITRGSEWPCGEGRAPQGSVIMLCAEDDAADTIRPRLDAAGADPSRVLIVTAVRKEDGQGRRTFSLAEDLDLLEREIQQDGSVRAVIIDPISSYLGKATDSHKNTDVRQVLEPIGEMAARLRVAVLCVTHISKSDSSKALHRFIGSIAFVAAARTAFMVASDQDNDGRRLFLQVKNNIAMARPGLAFRLEQRIVGDGIVASSICFENEHVSQTAEEALANEADSGERSARSEAVEFLQELLSAGAVPQREVKEHADAAGYSWTTIKRAKRASGIIAVREGGAADRGHWVWKLPDRESDDAKGTKNRYEAHVSDVGPLGEIDPLSGFGRGS